MIMVTVPKSFIYLTMPVLVFVFGTSHHVGPHIAFSIHCSNGLRNSITLLYL